MSGIDFISHAQRILDRSPTPPQFLPPDDPLRVVYELLNGGELAAAEQEIEGLQEEIAGLKEKLDQYRGIDEEVEAALESLSGSASTFTKLAEAAIRLEAYKAEKAKPSTQAHSDDAAVDRFASALKAKLADAREKGRGGWDSDEPGMQQRLSDMLRLHVDKGDPRDVANFAMFLFCRGESISPQTDDRAADAFFADVRLELLRARIKFPGDRVMTIALAEEFGELCKAILQESREDVRREAVQTAAMAARVVLDGDGSVTAWRMDQGLDALTVATNQGGA